VTLAVEQFVSKDRRIVDDELAVRILPLGLRSFVWLMRSGSARDWMLGASEKRAPGIGWRPVPERYIDDKLIESAPADRRRGQPPRAMTRGPTGYPPLACLPVWEVDNRKSVEPQARPPAQAVRRGSATSSSSN